MIITVQGTHYGNNEAVKVLNALAVMGVAKDQLTTMILQFTNKTRKSSEQYLIGKTLRNESLVQDASIPDISSGMDALCAHVLGQEENSKFFSEVSRSLVLQQDRNLFDIVISSRKESFEKEIINKQRRGRFAVDEEEEEVNDKDYLENLLESINDVYKIVYVLMPSKNQPLCQELLKYADVNIICLHQGNMEPITHGGRRELYVITDYCAGSMYSSKAVAQMYDQKIVYECMHNIQYNDACANGTALDYLRENINADEKSAGYSFIHNIEVLYNALMRKTGRKTADTNPDEITKYDGPQIVRVDWAPITAPVERHVVTTGFFKKKERSFVLLSDEKPEEGLPLIKESFDDIPAEKAESPGISFITNENNSDNEPGLENIDIPEFVDPENPMNDINDMPPESDWDFAETKDLVVEEPVVDNPVVEEPQIEELTKEEPEKPKKGLLASLFGSKNKKGKKQEVLETAPENEFAQIEIDPVEEASRISQLEAEETTNEESFAEETANTDDNADFNSDSKITDVKKVVSNEQPVIEIPDVFASENTNAAEIEIQANEKPEVVEPEKAVEEKPKKKTVRKTKKTETGDTIQSVKKTASKSKTTEKKPADDTDVNAEVKSENVVEAEMHGIDTVVTPEKPKAKKTRKTTKKTTTPPADTTTENDDWVIG